MPELLDPPTERLRDTVEVLARDRLVPLAADTTLDRSELARRVRDASKQAGVYPMTQPERFGGTGATALALVVVRDTLGRHDVGHLPGVFGPSPGALADAEEPLRSRVLAPFLAGEISGAFAFTEPDDAPRHTWAEPDGDDLVITGQKSYVTGGGDADFVTALVEVDGEGPVMVVVETDAPGVSLVRRFGTLDGSHHAAFTFEAVRVPRTNIVGGAGGGMRIAMSTVTGVRMAIAANCVGLCGYLAAYIDGYLRRPHRSGQPMGAVERNRLRYGELRARAYAARSTLYRTARLLDDGDPAINEAMIAKLVATETVGDLVDSAIQIVGGQALADDHPLSAIYRRVRAMRLAEGASDVLRINIARGALDLDAGRI